MLVDARPLLKVLERQRVRAELRSAGIQQRLELIESQVEIASSWARTLPVDLMERVRTYVDGNSVEGGVYLDLRRYGLQARAHANSLRRALESVGPRRASA